MSPKLIKVTTAILALLSIALLCNKIWNYYTVKLPQNQYSTIRIVTQHVYMVTSLVLPVLVLIMAFRSRLVNSLYLALAMAAYSVVILIPVENGGWLQLSGVILSIITGNLFILSMQYFPVKVTPARTAAIKHKWLKKYLTSWLRPKNLWIGMSAILGALALLEYAVPALQQAGNLVILLTGFAYLFINFRLTTGLAHSKILWLFWGLFMYILITIITVALFLYAKPVEAVMMTLALIQLLCLLFAFVMSVFFADAFDTGVLIRKTAINALFFVLAVFIYNTVEHFFLHWVAHTLQVSDALVSSLLSGLLVLFISPFHHRLTHYLSKKLKSKECRQQTVIRS